MRLHHRFAARRRESGATIYHALLAIGCVAMAIACFFVVFEYAALYHGPAPEVAAAPAPSARPAPAAPVAPATSETPAPAASETPAPAPAASDTPAAPAAEAPAPPVGR